MSMTTRISTLVGAVLLLVALAGLGWLGRPTATSAAAPPPLVPSAKELGTELKKTAQEANETARKAAEAARSAAVSELTTIRKELQVLQAKIKEQTPADEAAVSSSNKSSTPLPLDD